MTKLIVEMEMPKVCITKDGYYGNCPMNRVWCVQRNAPSGTIMRDAYAEMTENIPSWCPICGVLPDEHGDLIDRDVLYMAVKSHDTSDRAIARNHGRVTSLQNISTMKKGYIAEKHICLDDIIRAKAVIAAERSEYRAD